MWHPQFRQLRMLVKLRRRFFFNIDKRSSGQSSYFRSSISRHWKVPWSSMYCLLLLEVFQVTRWDFPRRTNEFVGSTLRFRADFKEFPFWLLAHDWLLFYLILMLPLSERVCHLQKSSITFLEAHFYYYIFLTVVREYILSSVLQIKALPLAVRNWRLRKNAYD